MQSSFTFSGLASGHRPNLAKQGRGSIPRLHGRRGRRSTSAKAQAPSVEAPPMARNRPQKVIEGALGCKTFKLSGLTCLDSAFLKA